MPCMPRFTHSLARSLTHSPSHLLNVSLTHSLANYLTYTIHHSLNHVFTISINHCHLFRGHPFMTSTKNHVFDPPPCPHASTWAGSPSAPCGRPNTVYMKYTPLS